MDAMIQQLAEALTPTIRAAIMDAFQVKEQQQDDLMTIEEVAEMLKVSKAAIYRQTSKNLIPHKKSGRKLFFSRQEILAWLGRNKQ